MPPPRQQSRFRKEVWHAFRQHDSDDREFIVCVDCNKRCYPPHDAWEADHDLPHYFGGSEGVPRCKACHRIKTTEQDRPAIDKARRVREKHLGIRKPKHKWPKRSFGM